MDVPRAAAAWKGFTPAYIDAWIGYPLQLAFRILSTLTLDHTLLGWNQVEPGLAVKRLTSQVRVEGPPPPPSMGDRPLLRVFTERQD